MFSCHISAVLKTSGDMYRLKCIARTLQDWKGVVRNIYKIHGLPGPQEICSWIVGFMHSHRGSGVLIPFKDNLLQLMAQKGTQGSKGKRRERQII